MNGAKSIIAAAIDILLFIVFGFILFVVISGGYTFSAFGQNLSAHTTFSPTIALIILLLVRKAFGLKTPVQKIPLIRFLRRLIIKDGQPAVIHLIGIIGLYSVAMSIVVVMKHNAYESHAYDLGIFDQLLWRVRHGHSMHSSILGYHFLGEHFSPILYPLSAIYFIWDDPRCLLIFQTIALAIGAVPVWLIAGKRLGSRNWGFVFALIYLCYQPLRNVNLYDFHPIALTTPLLLFTFWFLDQRKYFPFLVILAVALACQEEISEIVFILGLYVLLFHRKRVFGASLAVAGVAAFAVLVLYAIPYFRGTGESFAFFHRYDYLGGSTSEILKTLITRPIYVLQHVFTPEKRKYISNVFGPLGFLSILSPSHLMLAAPTFLQSILSNFEPQYTIKYQYTSPLTPFVFISAIFGLRNILEKGERLLRKAGAFLGEVQMQHCLAIILLLISLMYFGRSPVANIRIYASSPRRESAAGLLRKVPPEVSVSAQETFVPHLSHRLDIYTFPKVNKAQYVVIDISLKWMMEEDQPAVEIDALLKKGYKIEFAEKPLLLLKRGEPGMEIDALPLNFLP